MRAELLRVRDVAKVDLVGVQDEKIYLEFSTQQVAALGLEPNALMQTLQAQNALVPSGTVDAGPERIAIRVSGEFTSEASLKDVNFRFNDRFFRLSDIATVKRAYVDPPQPMFRYNGQPAIGLAISMTAGGDVLALGQNIKERVAQLARDLPIGVDLHLVADQPQVVHEAVGEFTKSLMEAIAIVLAVSFLALGWRPGIVVAIAIPLVLAITFVLMKFAGISLQRISLGALIIALGLLVDDAMIAVEMMITKMEEGYDKIKAATFAYTSTAFPMLTGTLVTIAGFVPVGFAQERRRRILLHAVRGRRHRADRVVGRGGAVHAADRRRSSCPTRSRQRMASTARRASRAGSTTASIWRCVASGSCSAATAGLFVLSLVGMRFVQQQFFPKSDRPELLVNLTLPQSASLKATQETVGAGREAAEGRSRHRALELLRRPGRDPLLPAARRAARERFLRPGRGRHQGLQGARQVVRRGWRRRSPRDFDDADGARDAARARTAGRLAAEVPRQRPRSGQDARARPVVRAGARPATPTRATSTTTGTSRPR